MNANRLELHWGSRTIPLRIRRESRSSMRIRVEPNGYVQVLVPSDAADSDILRRVRRRAGWIDRQLKSFERWRPRSAERNYISGESYLVLGRSFRLHVRSSVRNAVTLVRPRLVMELLPGHTLNRRRGLLAHWYAQRAKAVLPTRLDQVAPLFEQRGLKRPRLIIRAMTRRWGSYTPAGNLVLNSELVKVAPRLIDYVIAHELAHGIYPNHGPKWKALLTKIMPDWRERKQALERALL